ncbi:hypothetical protein C8J56DRAFT_1075885 [Mycena floridula]|nr:hypothetical protein C8J56DRAFT_1075885 [Mycena floridula]
MTFAFVHKFRHQFKRAPAKDSHLQLFSLPTVNDSQVHPAERDGSVQSSLCSVNELPQDLQQVNSPGSTQSTTLMNPTMPGLGSTTAAMIETSNIGPMLMQGLRDVSMGDVNAPMFSNNHIQQIQRATVHYHYGTQESSSNGRFTVIKEGDIFLQNESLISGYRRDIIRDFTGTVMDSPKFIRSYYGKDGLEVLETCADLSHLTQPRHDNFGMISYSANVPNNYRPSRIAMEQLRDSHLGDSRSGLLGTTAVTCSHTFIIVHTVHQVNMDVKLGLL